MSALDAATFDALFDAARGSVFRWEGHAAYPGPVTDTSLAAWREHAPRPVRSIRTSPWLARIARQVLDGVDWVRVRRPNDPLTDYDRWSLLAYTESQAVGERVLMAPTALDLGVPDFWLIGGQAVIRAVVMRYAADGQLVAREQVADPGLVADLQRAAQVAVDASVPLNEWLARSEVSA